MTGQLHLAGEGPYVAILFVGIIGSHAVATRAPLLRL